MMAKAHSYPTANAGPFPPPALPPVRSEMLLAEPLRLPSLPQPQRVMGFEIRVNPMLTANTVIMTDGTHTMITTANTTADRTEAVK